MQFYYTPYMILPLLSAVVNGGLALYAWQRRRTPAAFWLSWLLAGMAFWCLSYSITISATDLWMKNLAFKFGNSFFSVVLYTSVPMTLIMLGKSCWLSRGLLCATAVVPVISTLAGWTNDMHGWFRYDLHLVKSHRLLLFGYFDGPYYTQFHIKYVYLYFLLMLGLCLWGMMNKKQPRRLGVFFVALATVVPLLVDMFNLSPVKEIRYATSVGWITGVFYCFAVFYGRMLKLVPLAKNTLFEQMKEPVLVLDSEGRLAECNHAAMIQLELPSDAVGQLVSDLFGPGHALRRGISLENSFATLWDDVGGRRWQVGFTPVTVQDTMIGSMAVLHDVTKLYEVQESLRANEERFRRLADESADMVWQLDSELKFTYVNPADQVLRGFQAEEVLGTSVLSALDTDDAEMVSRANAERMKLESQGVKTGPLRYELRMMCKNGNYVWTEVNVNPLRNTDGKISGYIGVSRDISSRKSVEQRINAALQNEQEMRCDLERFLDMISHEYRTPLAIIQSNVDLIDLKRCSVCTIATEPLAKINRAVERLVDVFESCKRRNKIDQRPLTPVLGNIDVDDFLNQTLSAARDFWGERFVVDCHVTAGLVILTDSGLLRTVFLNLLDNAVKYSAEGTDVKIDVFVEDNQLVFSIFNESDGLLFSDTSSLFKKYIRGSNSSGTSGTGIGLYLASGILEQLGGKLLFEVKDRVMVTAMAVLPLEN